MRSAELTRAMQALPAAERRSIITIRLGEPLARAALEEAGRQEKAGAPIGTLRRVAVSSYRCPACTLHLEGGTSALLLTHLLQCPAYRARIPGALP